MDFTIITNNFQMVVVLACLVVGYILKNTFTRLPNKYIPTILAVLGAISNVVIGGLSFETIVYGALMGLASTGMHQAFTKFVENTPPEQ